MRFGSVCSGIEAASVAWRPLGWECAWTSEIDPHACSVLSARFPATPNLGNLIGLSERLTDDERAIDLLVGGTPCQGFSVAGQRGGMDDARSRLAWEFLGIARVARPRWMVWENVPGCTSTADGRDFGAILGAMAGLGYGLAWRILDAQFVRVDSHPRAVPQRRRRMFVVGHLGDWRPPVAVLLEPESMRGNPPPRREAGQGVAGSLRSRAPHCSGLASESASIVINQPMIAGTVTKKWGISGTSGPSGDECQNLVAHVSGIDGGAGLFVAPPLTGNPYGDHESREGLLVPFDPTQITSPENRCQPSAGDPCHPLAAGAHPPAIAFTSKDHGADASDDVAPTLRAAGHDASHANAGAPPAIAIDARQDPCCYEEHTGAHGAEFPPHAVAVMQEGMDRPNPDAGPKGRGWSIDGAAFTLEASHRPQSAAVGMTVRRLTPLECERLQGFSDDWTAVPPPRQADGRRAALPAARKLDGRERHALDRGADRAVRASDRRIAVDCRGRRSAVGRPAAPDRAITHGPGARFGGRQGDQSAPTWISLPDRPLSLKQFARSGTSGRQGLHRPSIGAGVPWRRCCQRTGLRSSTTPTSPSGRGATGARPSGLSRSAWPWAASNGRPGSSTARPVIAGMRRTFTDGSGHHASPSSGASSRRFFARAEGVTFQAKMSPGV